MTFIEENWDTLMEEEEDTLIENELEAVLKNPMLETIESLMYNFLKKHKRLPSQIRHHLYLHLVNKKMNYPKSTNDRGHWLIFMSWEKLDLAWTKLAILLWKKKLGQKITVSTFKDRSRSNGMIAINTYDAKDTSDILRIRKALRDIGIVDPIPYTVHPQSSLKTQKSFRYE